MVRRHSKPPIRTDSKQSAPSSFEDTVRVALGDYPAETTFLAAVSGGADSTAMLTALAAIRDRAVSEREAAFELHCIHIEHGIRPAAESRGDAEFVRALCAEANIPCRVVSVVPGKIAATAKSRGIGIEAAARLYRRKAWFREARRLEAENGKAAPVHILAAHTADDVLETVLMRILRGAGPSGLAAMPASRGRMVRPLIAISRRDVLDYLAARKIAWREDSTNTDTRFLRNRIRHCLIPQLSEHFPHWRTAINSLAETQSLAAAFIGDEAARRVQWSVGDGEGKGECEPDYRGTALKYQHSSNKSTHAPLYTNAENFFAQPPVIREEALFQGIDTLLPAYALSRGIKRKNIRRFSQGAITAADLGPIRIKRNLSNIILSLVSPENDLEFFPESCSPFPAPHSPHPSPHESGFSLLIKAPGSYTLKGLTVEVRECPAGGSGEDGVLLVLLPLVLRPCLTEDFIERHGRKIYPADLKSPGVIAVVDSPGVAAFIGNDGLLRCREDLPMPADSASSRVVQVKIISRQIQGV